MSSIPVSPSDVADDRTAKARIRDAAIHCIAENGVPATTARKVADRAGVSPGLIIHHFGSMEGLRSACDQYLVDVVRQQKHEVMSTGPNLDVLAALRDVDLGPLMAYTARVLTSDSAAVATLVDGFVDDAEAYLQEGVDSGMLQPSSDPRGRAVILTLWGLGALALHEHLGRLLGVDPTDPDFTDNPALAAYAGPMYEIYSNGVFTDAFATQIQQALADMPGESGHEGTS